MSDEPPEPAERVMGLDPRALLGVVRGRVQRVGDYELLERLAEGGMGVVWRARQVSLGRVVALKMIRSGLLASAEEVQRFRHEAESAAALDHPNIVPIYEVGEDEGRHFFSMKLIEGGNLGELGAQCDAAGRHAAPWARRVAGIIATIARAVHHAHQRGLLHRDVKPSNVLIDEHGQPHLTDFGLAKLAEGAATMTQTLAVLGTPSYMAPEQAAGNSRGLTLAADVYSLGAVLYELLSGRPPFEGDSTLELLRQVQERDAAPIRKSNPAISRDLDTICLKCLHKEPQRRYVSAEELAIDLEHWLSGKPIRARPVAAGEKLWLWSRRNPTAVIAGILLLALAIVSTVAALRLRGQRDEINETLRNSWIAKAHVQRLSNLQGRRAERLRVLAEAARIRPSMEVRNEVIAALALPDLGPLQTWYAAKPQPHTHQRLLTADGERYAIFGQQRGITIYRRSDGAVSMELVTPPNRLARAYLSPDGRHLINFDAAQNVFLWDLSRTERGPHRHSHLLPGPWEVFPDFTPDSRSVVLSGRDKSLRFFDLENGAEQRRIILPFIAHRVAVSPAGDQLALSSGNSVHIWSISHAAEIQSHQHRFPVTAIVWHPAGRIIAVGYENGESQLLDSESGASRWLAPHQKYINSMDFDPPGNIVASSAFDGTHRFSDPATARGLFEMPATGGLQATKDGRYFAVFEDDGSIGAREIVRSGVFCTLTSPRTGYSNLSGVDISLDSRWLVAGDRAGLHIWDIAQGNEVCVHRLRYGTSPTISSGWTHYRDRR